MNKHENETIVHGCGCYTDKNGLYENLCYKHMIEAVIDYKNEKLKKGRL